MMNRKPRNPPTKSKDMLTLELHNTRQGSREDDEKLRATRARVIQHMERIEFAHES
jgi:hypothetical protein